MNAALGGCLAFFGIGRTVQGLGKTTSQWVLSAAHMSCTYDDYLLLQKRPCEDFMFP